MPRVLIAPQALYDPDSRHVRTLADAGLEVLGAPADLDLNDTPARTRALADHDCAAVLAGSEPYPRTLIEAVPGLRVIARLGVGFDAIDLDAARERKIAVAITPGTNDEAVAEHTVAMILALGRGLVQHNEAVHAGKWPRRPMPPVRTKTLGLVGLGRIGRAVFTRAVALGMNVIAYEPAPDRDFVARHGVRLVSLDELLAEADYVSLHVPLMPQTAGMIDRQTLASMKRGAMLVNTARGGLVVERDLADALASGHLAAAALDVFADEPPVESPLLRLPNVLATPHVAGVDDLSLAQMAEKAAWVVAELWQGRWPADCIVNGEIGPEWKW